MSSTIDRRGVAGGAWRACAVAAVLLAAVAFVLPAQTAASAAPSKETTIEELFLKSVEFQIVREKAFSGDYDLKMNALDDLEKKINDGSFAGNDQQVEFVLEYLAMEGSGSKVREAGRVVNNFPEVRRRAANLLGRLGTDDADNALLRVTLIDDEPIVKAEAVYGLGVIGRNPNGEVVQVLTYAYANEDQARPDNNLGYAYCLALEKISKTSGSISDPAAYQLLLKIAQGNYLRTVRTKALQVLEELKGVK